MDRKGKQDLVEELSQAFSSAELVILVRHSGVTVSEASDLRVRCRAVDVRYKVTKNSLVKRALKGTDYEHMDSLFSGPTAIAYGSDAVSAAKVIVDYMKGVDKFEIVGGAHKSIALDATMVKQLASLPSLDELRGKIVGLLQAPAVKLVGVTQAPVAGLARVISAHASQ